jgi:hypothetical protein
MNFTDDIESKRKVMGYFPNISFRRSDDNILHISIGNSSKITKRHKKKSWLFAKLWRLSHKKKSPRHKWFFSHELSKDDAYRLSHGSLNLVNEEMLISINKRKYSDHRRRASYEKIKQSNETQHRQLKLIGRNFPHEFPDSEFPNKNADNELDCYMDEIKQREMKCFEA